MAILCAAAVLFMLVDEWARSDRIECEGTGGELFGVVSRYGLWEWVCFDSSVILLRGEK